MVAAFKLHVVLSWGEERNYLLANDVEPGLEHRYQTRENWQEVMKGALINVPVGPYIKDNRVIPPIATAKVLDVTAVDSRSKVTTDPKPVYNGCYLGKPV